MAMTRKQISKVICGNLMRKFDWLQSQESTLVSVVMDSLKEIENIEKGVVPKDSHVMRMIRDEPEDDGMEI